MESPDAPNTASTRRMIIASGEAGGKMEMMALVPADTIAKPFSHTLLSDKEDVVLTNNEPENWGRADNGGEVMYLMLVIPPR